jgi:hypothetical protein
MTTTASFHMYAEPAIRFRDPFRVSKRLSPPTSSKGYHHQPQRSAFVGPRTPSPEMNPVPPHYRADYERQEHGPLHGDNMTSQNTQRAHVPPTYPPMDMSDHNDYSRPLLSGTANVRSSPAKPVFIEERRRSHANAIASNFQIPRDVNDSGGSLAELAAQVRSVRSEYGSKWD